MSITVELGRSYLYIDNLKSYQHSLDGYELATQYGDSAKMVRAGRVAGIALRELERAKESIEILERVLPIAKRNYYDPEYKDEYKKILNGLAVAHTFLAEYDKALEYHFESLVVRESEGDQAAISIALNNIGFVYFKLHNYESALKYYERTLRIRLELKDTVQIHRTYLNIGLCYLQTKRFKEAKETTQHALALCGDHCDDEILMMGEFGLGEASYKLGDFIDARNHLIKSLEIARKNNDQRWQAENLVYLGVVAFESKEYELAAKHLSQADTLAKNAAYNQLLMDVYKHFSNLYNRTGDYQNAALYQRKYIQLSDSLIGQELVKNISKIQANYEERENIATIADRDFRLSQQRKLNIAWVVIAFMAGLLVLVLQFGNRNIKRVNAKLSEAKEVIQMQNAELENKNRELDIEVDKKTSDLARVNQSLKQVNDELDNFIYKTSHDIRGPLASLKGMCNVALMDVKDPIALEYLKKLDATAERLNSILTRLVIINQINNSKISIEPIDFKAIVSEVLLLEKKKGLPPDLKITTFIDPQATIESDKELVRIVLENLIDNAIKFYNDSERVDSFMNVHISRVESGNVKVRVIDNGIGISESSPGKLFQMFSRASERSETGGIGLYITKTAVEKVGGKIGLLTTPEGYTEFYVILPAAPYQEWEKPMIKLG
jgi:signal transduction histidine kinase